MAAPHRVFTVSEVNALVPKLERIFGHVLQLRAGMRAVETKLTRANIAITDEGLVIRDEESHEIRQAKAFFRGYYDALRDELETVKTLGGEVKDLEHGLVDFHGRRNGEDILLCWKLGERACAFWHTTDAGFTGRRPVDEQIGRTPERLD